MVNVDGQPSRTENYGYDELYRLTGVGYGDGVTQSYAFDNMGNRLTKTENGTPEALTYNAANMLLSRGGLPYVNDAVGRGPLSVIPAKAGNQPAVSRRPERLLDSRLRGNDERGGGSTSQFVYGADGLRRTSSVNGSTVHYVLDGSMPIRELTDALLNKATYLIGPRGPEYRRDDTTGTIRWYCYDGLGSVLGEVDTAGNLTASRKYDVYGAVRSSTGTSTSKHRFVGSLGHPSEPDTGLIYMRARWMDPITGRFLSEDPARDGANWFDYCRGNPVNAVDADGENPVLIYVLVSGVAGGVFACLSAGAWTWRNFARGFVLSATVAFASVFGPGAGALAGALAGLVDAWLTNGNLLAGAVFGALAGGLGGVACVEAAAVERQMLIYLLLSVDVGFLTSGASSYVSNF